MQRYRLLFLSTLLITLGNLLSHPAVAQRAAGDIGIGLQAGQPSGLSIGVYQPTGMGLDILAAWDLNDFFYINPHGLFTNHIGDSETFHLFYGPGFFVGLHDEGSEDRLRLGVSGTGGLSVMLGSFEIYGRVTPRLELIDETDVDIGGGLGFRLYL